MNEHPTESERLALGRLLNAVAAEDSLQEASPQVRAAVMQQWDDVGPRLKGRSRRYLLSLGAVGSLASAVAVLVVLSVNHGSSPSQMATPHASGDVNLPGTIQRVPSLAPTLEMGARMTVRHPPRRRERGGTRIVTNAEPGLVLAMDPLDDNTLSIVRVRVPGTALAMLGVVPAELNDSGSVDLEMLVGEDGAARLIQRAMPVATREE